VCHLWRIGCELTLAGPSDVKVVSTGGGTPGLPTRGRVAEPDEHAVEPGNETGTVRLSVKSLRPPAEQVAVSLALEIRKACLNE
jgi:hypothetical protein